MNYQTLGDLDYLKHRIVCKVEVAKVVDWSLPGVDNLVGKLRKRDISRP